MSFFAKKIEKQIASCHHRLIETHYRDVDNMYRRDGCPLVTGNRCCGTELSKLHYCISSHTCSIKERGKQ